MKPRPVHSYLHAGIMSVSASCECKKLLLRGVVYFVDWTKTAETAKFKGLENLMVWVGLLCGFDVVWM